LEGQQPPNYMVKYPTDDYNSQYILGKCLADDKCSSEQYMTAMTSSVYCQTRGDAGASCQISDQLYHCKSEVCAGPSGSTSGYCCSDEVAADIGACASGTCESGSGLCSDKKLPGETCDSSDDCYNGAKCLPEGGGGRCCEFTKQSFDDAQFSGGMNDYNNIGKCAACGDASIVDSRGEARAGMCQSCAAGYTLLEGQQPPNYMVKYPTDDYNSQYILGKCLADDKCSSEQYMTAMTSSVYCQTRGDAGASCQISDQLYHCKSEVCAGPSGSTSGYCCSDEVAADIGACASGTCESGSGLCSDKKLPGETCDSSDDCYNGAKCLPRGAVGVAASSPSSRSTTRSSVEV
jgi:hypothetical protein